MQPGAVMGGGRIGTLVIWEMALLSLSCELSSPGYGPYPMMDKETEAQRFCLFPPRVPLQQEADGRFI